MSLIALDDTGNRFGDAMQNEFAEWEREEIAKRTWDGPLEKCRSGLVIRRKRAAYGYRASEGGDALEVSEPEMEVVRRIFRSVAEGASVRSVRLSLEREGVTAPSGIVRWNHTTIRNILRSSLYAPHTAAEVAEVVEPAVAAQLEEGRFYGLWAWNTKEERTSIGRDPERDAEFWSKKLTETEDERRGYHKLAARGHMSDDELTMALADLDEARESAEHELETARARGETLRRLEHDRDAFIES